MVTASGSKKKKKKKKKPEKPNQTTKPNKIPHFLTMFLGNIINTEVKITWVFTKTSKKQHIPGLPSAAVFLKLKLDFRRTRCKKHKDTDH